jgi:hypothetical protein
MHHHRALALILQREFHLHRVSIHPSGDQSMGGLVCSVCTDDPQVIHVWGL